MLPGLDKKKLRGLLAWANIIGRGPGGSPVESLTSLLVTRGTILQGWGQGGHLSMARTRLNFSTDEMSRKRGAGFDWSV